MTLLSSYNDSKEPQLGAKLLMAIAVKARVELATLTNTDPEYGRQISMIRAALRANPETILEFTRIFAANGITNDSTDTQIQTAVDSNWGALSKIFDPEV